MRTMLKHLGTNQTITFTAVVDAFGHVNKPGKHFDTVCFVDVAVNGLIVTDHVWAMLNKITFPRHAHVGDRITFTAQVVKYQKGYQGKDPRIQKLCPIKTDYSLSRYQGITVIK